MQYFVEMEEAGMQPDLKAYNSLISACARGARWEDAWDCCSSMRRSAVPPNTRTYNALISACERAGQPDRALEAFGRMQKESGGPCKSLFGLRKDLWPYRTAQDKAEVVDGFKAGKTPVLRSEYLD